jgi:bacteriocin biosynthesis cyclodehydratase domain-containing protein
LFLGRERQVPVSEKTSAKVNFKMLNGRVKNCEHALGKCEDLDVVSIGEFGSAVARRLRHYRHDVRELNVPCPMPRFKEATEESLRGKSNMVVASSHPATSICERLAGIARESQCSFLPVVIDESVLRLGPVVVPGIGGCWNCWAARREQHDGHPQETAALHEFYNHHPGTGPCGYLDPFAWIAASLVAAILSSRQHLEHWAGKIWQMDLFSREVTTGELVGVDGCGWCGLNRPLETRTYREIQQALGYLWDEDSMADARHRELGTHSKCEGLK